MTPMLAVENLTVAYGAVTALRDVSFTVEKGGVSTLLGANGAGKSTVLRALSGLVKPVSGKIFFDGADIAGKPSHKIVSQGLIHVPEGRMVFPGLTVTENLRMGAYLRDDKPGVAADLEKVFALFPRLKEREKQTAGTMSGGEQQMLAIGRALMGRPRLLMLDEPSLGIAPLLTRTIFEKLVQINRELGITLLIVEQNANLALEVADHGHVLETGRIIASDTAAALRADPRVREAYLGE